MIRFAHHGSRITGDTIVERMQVEPVWLADAAGPTTERGERMLDALREPVTGTVRQGPPLSPSDLPSSVEELPTWAERLIPAGLHESMAVALFEPGGRRVGFLALLSEDDTPPTRTVRNRVASAVSLLAEGIDPMRSITAASRLVGGAFAGVVLLDSGPIARIPGLADHRLLAARSSLLDVVRARMDGGEPYLSFLWPAEAGRAPREHVQVTCLAIPDPAAPDLVGVVLLSPPSELHGLTHRELEVLGLIVEGGSNQQIADRLIVTPRTVATHVEHILVKLASPSRTHAAVQAQREGLYVPLPPSVR